MLDAYARHRPAAVTGPLFPEYETDPDPWLLAGGFFVRREFPDGHRVPAAGSGNLLLDLDAGPPPRAALRRAVRADRWLGHPLHPPADRRRRGRGVRAAGGGDRQGAGQPDDACLDAAPAVPGRHHLEPDLAWSWPLPGSRRLLARLRLTAGGGARVGVGALRHALGRATGSLTHQARGSRTSAAGAGHGGGRLGRHRHRVPTPGRADAVSRVRLEPARRGYRFAAEEGQAGVEPRLAGRAPDPEPPDLGVGASAKPPSSCRSPATAAGSRRSRTPSSRSPPGGPGHDG